MTTAATAEEAGEPWVGGQGDHITIGAHDDGGSAGERLGSGARPSGGGRAVAAAPSVCDDPTGGAMVGACANVPAPGGPTPAPAAAQAPALDPAAYVRDYLNAVPLPEPDPRIAPGRMLVGWEAFLEVGGGLDFAFTDPTAFGPLAIDARAEVMVDWGDGTGRQGPYPSLGGPFPDGDITHVYDQPGAYDVVVTLVWVADWTFAGQQGSIPTGLSTTATIADFPVQEGQAVTD